MKKNTTRKGTKAEEEYAEMKRREGFLSFVRARKTRFGSYDMWKLFDVISMSIHGIELAQIKSNRARNSQKLIKAWLRENVNKLPDNLKCVVAVRIDASKGKPARWRIKEVDI